MLNLFQHPTRGSLRFMRDQRQPCVYILASQPLGTLYIGVSSDLGARLYQHRTDMAGGFTAKYAINRLVHFEMFEDMPTAIAREKQLKRWRRDWKLNLIETENPHWNDLAIGLGLAPLVERTRRDGC